MTSAFEVISASLAGELTIVRNVRNVFAHATANLSFDTPEIAGEISRSRLLRVIDEKMSEQFDDELPVKLGEIPAKKNFILLVRIVFIILDNTQKEKGELALSV